MPTPKKKVIFQDCEKCGRTYDSSNYLPTRSPLCPSGYIHICNRCLEKWFAEQPEETKWEAIDKICQLVDVPFIPARWQKLYDDQKEKAISTYVAIFQSSEYSHIGWREYQKKYEELREEGTLDYQVIPGLEAQRREELKTKWGSNYDDEELQYLERLFQGVQNTQNINGDLQMDQALKLCKLSLIIDSRIREGADIDKMLGSYEKLVKIGEFTPKNAKNAEDFDSVGELFAYLEKTGFVNKFYDGVKRDIVDITMNNIQTFCQRLYTQEPGIGEEIDKRIESLKMAKDIEDSMGLQDNYATDEMSMEVDKMFENEDFNPEVGE